MRESSFAVGVSQRVDEIVMDPAVWREIGEAFLTPFRERTDRQRDLTASGLCLALAVFAGLSNYAVRLAIYRRMHALGDEMEVPETRGVPWFWADANEDEARGMFALLVAGMPRRDRVEFFWV